MAWIGTVNVGTIALPDDQPRLRRSSVGTDAAGNVHVVRIGTHIRDLVIVLRHKTQAVVDALETYLWATEAERFDLLPDAWIDFGAGNGVAVHVKWMDAEFSPKKVTYDAYDMTLTFRTSAV